MYLLNRGVDYERPPNTQNSKRVVDHDPAEGYEINRCNCNCGPGQLDCPFCNGGRLT